jgi:hypothetical protein
LRDAVLREARELERAQAPRRQALRAELARGTGIEVALGAPVAPETAAWLHGWARQEETSRAAPRPAPIRRRAWRKPGLVFGASFSIALLAGLAVQFHWLSAPEIPPAPMLAASPPPPSPARFETDAAGDEAPAPDASISPPMPAAAAERRSRSVIVARQAETGHSAAPPSQPREAADSAPLADRDELLAQSGQGDRKARHGNDRAAQPGAMQQRAAKPVSADAMPARTVTPAASLPAKPEFRSESVARGVATAMPAIPADVWPLDGEQWKRLAATLGGTPVRHSGALHAEAPAANRSARADITAEIPRDAPRRPWRLLVAAPDAPEVLALAAFLRQSLPPGEELAVQSDAGIPRGFARLVPPER